MRAIDLIQQSAFDANVTVPRFLVEIVLDEVLNLSTRESIAIDEKWWEEGKIQIDAIRTDSATIRIDNHNYQFTRGALNGSYLRNSVKIWAAYGLAEPMPPYILSEDYWPEDYIISVDTTNSILLFDGYISGTPQVAEWLVIECNRTLPKRYPFQKIRPPFANFLPAMGTVIAWGGDVYRIES